MIYGRRAVQELKRLDSDIPKTMVMPDARLRRLRRDTRDEHFTAMIELFPPPHRLESSLFLRAL